MNDLVERLEHFEDHQNEVGDRYGAEVLHYAATEIRRLTEEVEGRIETETQLVREIDRLKLENERLLEERDNAEKWAAAVAVENTKLREELDEARELMKLLLKEAGDE